MKKQGETIPPVKVKYCGLRRVEDIRSANETNPDYVGFVFAKDRRRYVEPEVARLLRNGLHPQIGVVGVFVDEEVEVVASLLREDIIDIAQLHGHEDAAYIEHLRSLTDKPIWKAFHIETAEDVAAARDSKVDLVLVDKGIGGTGMVFDWSLLADMDKPFLLAGGLTIDNIEEALAVVKPYGVDVSSGIETDGVKDPEKMKVFMEKVRKERRA